MVSKEALLWFRKISVETAGWGVKDTFDDSVKQPRGACVCVCVYVCVCVCGLN